GWDRPQLGLVSLDLGFIEALAHVEPDRARDEPQYHEHHHDLVQRHSAAAPQAAELLDVALHGTSPHFGTKVVSCMIGMRIEKTMNATPTPITTIMSGSSKLVSAPMRISTCAS